MCVVVYGGFLLGRGMCGCVVVCEGGEYLLCVVVCGRELCVSGRRRKCVCEVCGEELWLFVVVYGGGLCVLVGFRRDILSCGVLWYAKFH